MSIPLKIQVKHINLAYIILFSTMLAGLTLCRLCIEPASILLIPLTLAVFHFNNVSYRPLLTSPAFLLLIGFLAIASLSLVVNGLSVEEIDRVLRWVLALIIGYTAAMLLSENLLLALGTAPLAALAAYPLIAGAIQFGLLDATLFSSGRLELNSIHPNRLGTLLGSFLMLCAGLAIFGKGFRIRLAACICFPLLLVLLFLVGSRAAMLGVSISLFILLAAAYARQWKLFVVALGLLALVSLSLTSMLSDNAQVQRVKAGLSDPLADPTLQSRLVIWHVAWKAFIAAPIFGAGFDHFKHIYSSEVAKHGEELDRKFPIVERVKHPHAHNFFLHLMAETGLTGVLLMTGLWLYLILAGFKLQAPGMVIAACLLCLLITFQLNMNLYGREQSTLAFLLMGAQTWLIDEARRTRQVI